jgi:hypothetical protein
VSNRRGIPRERPSGRAVAALAAVAVFAVLLSACGGGDDPNPRVLDAGQVDIKLPPGFKVVHNTVVAPRATTAAVNASPSTLPAGAASGTPGTPGDVGTTPTTAKSSIPLDNKSDPTSDLLGAFAKFRGCLGDLGVKFIGAPDPNNPNSPTNNPEYIKNLGTCAARSNIIQVLKAAQSSEENLTPAEIKQRNKGYLKWRQCMVDRGWNIPKPTPDAKGRLFSFGSGSTPQLKPPAGKDAFTSKDIEQCAAKAQRAAS